MTHLRLKFPMPMIIVFGILHGIPLDIFSAGKSYSFYNFLPVVHCAVFYAHLRLFIELWTTNDTYQGTLPIYGPWLSGCDCLEISCRSLLISSSVIKNRITIENYNDVKSVYI